MKNGIKVTIGVCVKNAVATIGEAIDSIVNQDFPHAFMELIVVDGHSKDGTMLIIKEKLMKYDIRSRFFEENKGLGMARQIVVENAGGGYIVWVDGDMILSKDYVRMQVEFMEQNPNVGIAGGKHGIRQGEGLVAALENIVRVVHSEYGEIDASRFGFLPATCGTIYRVDAIRQVGGFDESIKGAAEDIDAAYKVKVAGWSICINDVVFQEACRSTWKTLWDQFVWYGYGAHFLLHKDSGLVTLYKMVPYAGFLAGVLCSFKAYKLMRQKFVFILPIHYTFKRIAWCLGFVKAQMDGYGHK